MHQTFYIDIDEEITSIVEKLRKTEAPEAVMVVPKRALLIQSIVNLKLLRKVADDLGLKISIVTQDKLGKMLVKKAGISLQQKLEDSLEELRDASDEDDRPKREFKKEIETAELGDTNSRSKRNLEKIGSAEYFATGSRDSSFSDQKADWNELDRIKEKEVLPEVGLGEKTMAVANGNLSDGGASRKRNMATMDVSAPARNASHNDAGGPARNASRNDAGRSMRSAVPAQKASIDTYPVPEEFSEIPFSKTRKGYDQNVSRDYETKQKEIPRDKQLENFFYANNFSDKNGEKYDSSKQEANGKSGRFLKAVTILGAVVLVLGLAYVAYIYVPKATVTIFAKKEVKSADMTITGDVNADSIDYDKSIIPAKLMEFDEEVAKTFDATGSKNVSNQKAKGKITIYNEFSSSPQPLVATTRFLSDNQKMFRLVQGVTVPGTTVVGSETKPGVVEADIVADEAGDSYNIDATSFTIPGFKSSGNDKYTKIYAKSEMKMAGGGNGNDAVKVVTDKDISGAKDKISLEINSAIKDKVKESAAGTVVLDDAIVIDEPVYRVSNSEGETADSFEIKVQAHARALVFFESDIKKVANSVIAKSGNGKINIDSGTVLIDYGKPNANFKLGTIEIKTHASNVMQPNIDLGNLKRGILGKNNDELGEYLKTYPNIEKAEVEYFPQLFVSKIPMNEKRVEVILNATTP